MVAPVVLTTYLAVLFAETPANAPTPDFVGLIPEWRFVDTLFQDRHRSSWAAYQEARALGHYLQRSWGHMTSDRATEGDVMNCATVLRQFAAALRCLDTVHVSQSLMLADVLNRYRFYRSVHQRLWVSGLRGVAKGRFPPRALYDTIVGWERLRRSYSEWLRHFA